MCDEKCHPCGCGVQEPPRFQIDWKQGVEIRLAPRLQLGMKGMFEHLTTITGWRIRNLDPENPQLINTREQKRVDRIGPLLFTTTEVLRYPLPGTGPWV